MPLIFDDVTYGQSWIRSSISAKGRKRKNVEQICTTMFRWALSQAIVEADPGWADAIRPRYPARSGLGLRRSSWSGSGWMRLALSRSGGHSEAERDEREVWRDQRTSRQGDRLPKMDLDTALPRAPKWASARHADCGPRARDARTTAIWRREWTAVPAGERRGVEFGPYLALSLNAPDKPADRDVHLTRSQTNFLYHHWRRWDPLILLPRSSATGVVQQGHPHAGPPLRAHRHGRQMSGRAHALKVWDERLRAVG